MTLEQFVKPIDGRTTFTIYKDRKPFLYKETYDYTVLSDDEWEEARSPWKHNHKPLCMSQTEWWPEVEDLEVDFWHVGDCGYRGPQVIIFLKSAEKEETPEAATSGESGK